MTFLINFIDLLFWALWLAILGRVLVSWILPTRNDPLSIFLFQVTEPILAPLRRVLPQMGTIDLSPMIAIIGLQLIRGMLIQSL